MKKIFEFLDVDPHFKLSGEVELLPTFQVEMDENDEIAARKVPCVFNGAYRDVAKVKKGKIVWIKILM